MALENLLQLSGPTDFTHKVDWSVDPFDDTIIPSGTPIVQSNARYEYADGFAVAIGTAGRTIKLARASGGDIDLNFTLNSALLVAANPDDVDSDDHAAIRISLSPGVSAVGAYVSGYRKGASTQNEQDVFIAEMWLRLAGGSVALPCAKGGSNGSTRPQNQAPTAPFVGAKSTGADIREVCFDVSLFGKRRFDFVVIGDLWLVRG
jgi:hypothetical protein